MPDSFNMAAVIPVGPGRRENLELVLDCVVRQTDPVAGIVLVFDGPEANPGALDLPSWTIDHPPIITYQTDQKHEPGHEQPRNLGAAIADQNFDITHVWFLDTDVMVGPTCVTHYHAAMTTVYTDRILIGPYDWLPPGIRDFGQLDESQYRNDPRWPSFDEHDTDYVSREKLNDGLACFSGNLVWPIDEFKRVGGFWNDIHHGRCEDGELGLRAVAEGVPIGFVRNARGWHLWHPVNQELAMQRNARDVPMLNARHPWVEAGGLVVVDKDGKRFDQRCEECGELVNTGDYWNHKAAHGGAT